MTAVTKEEAGRMLRHPINASLITLGRIEEYGNKKNGIASRKHAAAGAHTEGEVHAHSAPLCVRHDFLRLLYAGMLLELDTAAIRSFWQQQTLPGIPGDDECAKYDRLWSEENTIDLRSLAAILNAFELFLLRRRIDPAEFVGRALQKVNVGLAMSVKSAVMWAAPFLDTFYRAGDLRPLILNLTNTITEKLAPGLVHRLVKQESTGQWSTATILLMHSLLQSKRLVHSSAFARSMPAINSELWAALPVQLSPVSLKLPPFERRFMIAECRTIDQALALPLDLAAVDAHLAETLKLSTMSFHDFCRWRNLNIQKFGIPDIPIVVSHQNYFCPVRKQIALHEGCAYGAPVYLYGLRYLRNVPKPADFLSSILKHAVREDTSVWSLIRSRHQELVAKASQKAEFVYYVQEESCSLNGKHLIKYAPAKILRKILSAYTHSGQTEFEYRDILRDPAVFLGQESPNLGIRFNRLCQALDEMSSDVKLVRIAPGKVRLDCRCAVGYREA
jgi:hypothetical protein